MRHGNARLHSIGFRVEGAETHGPFEVLNGAVGLAVPDPQISTKEPGGRQVWIEHEGPIKQSDATIKVAGEMGERVAASRERDRIVSAQLDGPARQSSTLGGLPRAIDHPAIDLAPEMAPRRHRMGRRKIRIELYRLIKQGQRD